MSANQRCGGGVMSWVDIALVVAATVSTLFALRLGRENAKLQQELARRNLAAETSAARSPGQRQTTPIAEPERAPSPPSPRTVAVKPPEPQPQQELLARISELEGMLAEKERELTARAQQRRPRDPNDRRREEGPRRDRMTDFMSRLRESDPQRYAEIRERMRNLNERMNSAMGHQQEFLSALATDQMSEDQAASHEAFLELLARNREILGLMEVNPETENAGELRRELRENMRQVGELLGVEREIALQAMARDLGYEGEAIPQFQQYVESILDMTSVRSLWSGRSGRGGGPRSDSTRPAAPADTRP